MIFQIDYTIVKGTRLLSTGEHSRIIEAKDKKVAEEELRKGLKGCDIIIEEIIKL
jgi:hypothetical protein